MVSSSADIVLQNCRISQSESSTINICDVVNIMALQHVRVSGYKNVTVSIRIYRLLFDYRDIWIYSNERTLPTNYFVIVLPSRQIKQVIRLTACNYERCVFVTIFSG